MGDRPALTYHHDAALFRDALRFTSAATHFSERLVEKDYHCSLILVDLRRKDGKEHRYWSVVENVRVSPKATTA